MFTSVWNLKHTRNTSQQQQAKCSWVVLIVSRWVTQQILVAVIHIRSASLPVFAVILYWPQTLTKSKATHINPTQQECMAFPAREHCALCEMDSTFTLLVRIAAAACSVTGIPCNNKSSTPWANLLDLTMYSRLHPLVSAGTSKLPLRGRWLAFWYRSAIPRPESPYFSKYSSRPWKMLKVIGVYQSPCYISLCLHKNNPIKNNAT